MKEKVFLFEAPVVVVLFWVVTYVALEKKGTRDGRRRQTSTGDTGMSRGLGYALWPYSVDEGRTAGSSCLLIVNVLLISIAKRMSWLARH